MMKEGEVLAGKYKLLRQLGEGAEGSVYLAIHMQTEMFWAIKEIRVCESAEDACFCHELQMMKRLKMHHLAQVIDVLQEKDRVFLVMEHVRGVSLDKRIRNRQVLSAREVQDVAEQVTEALCYLEKQKPPVCHLDIKPSNLIRRPDGLIKLVDFGSAWKEKERMKGMGTDGYAAPEQYRTGGPQPDVRTDLYGLGATLYRIAAGMTWRKAADKSCVPNIPPQLSDLILRCLREDPGQRFQSAAALREALKRIRKKERRKRRRLQLLGSLSIAFPAAALCIQILPSALDLSADESWNYEKLVREASVVSEAESRDYYRRAVFLNPSKSDAYLKFLEDAQTDGSFSDEEETFLRDTLHSVRPGSERTFEELLAEAPEAYLKTAVQIALAYWYSSPREDSRRIAMGWFEKVLEAAQGTQNAEAEEARSKASWYLKLGAVLEKLHTESGEDPSLHAMQYWEDLSRILADGGLDSILQNPLQRLKFCRETLQTLPFLSGELARGGIGRTLQIGRIEELKQMAEEVAVPAGREALYEPVQKDVEKACLTAMEAARKISDQEDGKEES